MAETAPTVGFARAVRQPPGDSREFLRLADIALPAERLEGLRLSALSRWQIHVWRGDTGETLMNALHVGGTPMPSVEITGMPAMALRAKVRTLEFPPGGDELAVGAWIDATLPGLEPARPKRRAKSGRGK